MTHLKLDTIQPKNLIPGYTARMVHSETMTLAYWIVEEGALLPKHSHPHEQVATILEGEFELTVDGQPLRMTPGDIKIIPGGIPHSGKAITACQLLDIFHPVREEYR